MLLKTGKRRGFVIKGTPKELRRVSRLPGTSYRKSEGVVRIPSNVQGWKVIKNLNFSAINPQAREERDRLKREFLEHRRQIRAAERRFKKTGKTDIPVPLKLRAFSHQVRAYGFAMGIPQCGLFMDQGTGKTLVAIAVAGGRWKEGQVKRVLVICPKSVKPVWPKELRKHAKFPYSVSMDSKPEEEGVQFWVTNYDKVNREKRRLLKWKPDLVIIDESHKIKNRKANRTKAVIAIGSKVKYKLALTGTPMGKCISETWSQFKFLNPSIFGSSYSLFKDNYLVMGGYKNYNVVGYKNEGDFSKKLHSISFRVTKGECLDLPPLTYQRLYVESDSKTEKIYRDLDIDLYGEVGGEEVTASSQAVKQMKLRQVVGGLVKSDSNKVAHISEAKRSTLSNFLEDRGKKKTVIFFSFTHEIRIAEKVCKKLKLRYLTLEGATKDQDREVFEDRFESSDYEVALIQVSTGGEGLTLVSADVVIFYSPTFSFIQYSQARDRIYRIGQTSPVTVIFLIMENTVDERVVEVLECNSQLTNQYLETNRDYSLGEQTMSDKFTVADLASEFNMTPAEARKTLRNSGIQKPEGGWNWPSSKKVPADIRKALKDGGGKTPKKTAKKKGAAKKGKSVKKSPAKKKPVRRRKKTAEAE